jgi:non-ribosomal peptide synthetase component F
VVDAEQGLVVSAEYSTDLFDAPTISRMMRHYERVLELVQAQPDMKLNEILEVLAEADRQERLKKQAELKEIRLKKFRQARRSPSGNAADHFA